MNDTRCQPVIIYDGTCKFCIAQVDRIRRRDRPGVFEYLPRHAEGIDARFPKLAEQDFDTGLRLIRPDGSILIGADAVHGIMQQLRPWSLIAWMYHIPPLYWLANLLYRWIARNRHRLAGDCVERRCEP